MKPRILVPAGMGDIHFAALKLESFCKRHLLDKPEVWVWDFDGRPRSLDFIKRLPMCDVGGYFDEPIGHGFDRDLFDSFYSKGQINSVRNFRGFDYLLCVNGSLTEGKNFQTEILPHCRIDWDYKLRQTEDENNYGREILRDGKYVIFFFSDYGMFKNWVKVWNKEAIVKFLTETHYLLPEYRFILTGKNWDLPLNEEIQRSLTFPAENFVGLTNLDELLGMIRNASGFAGWCGGNTII
jgi:ADP-heptose:LPS heptosyltransferase